MKVLILSLCLFTFAVFSNDCADSKKKKNAVVSNTSQVAETKASPTPVPKKVSADSIWEGESGGFEINWTKENIVVKNISSGQTVFSARDFAMMRLKKEFKANFDKNGEPYFEDFTFRYQIISVAGNLLSLHEQTSYSPQSYSNETLLTVDLNKPQQTIYLTDLFSENEIVNALALNEIIAAKLKQKNTVKTATFADFRNNFNKTANEATEVSDDQLDECWFPENVFKSFAFNKVENEKVTVDLAIPCRAEMREDDVYPLALTLPIPEKLRSELSAAMNKKLLSSDFKNLSSNDETVITFTSDSFK